MNKEHLIPIDQADRKKAIEDIKENFIVEAGAGTGKTTILVSRILTLVENQIPLDKIVSITFTEKAAGELKTRIQKALQEKSEKEAAPEIFLTALKKLEKASISTIHAFCSAILREHPIEVHVVPGFTLLNKMEFEMLFSTTWGEWFYKENLKENSILSNILSSGIKISELYGLAKDIYGNRDLLANFLKQFKTANPLDSEDGRLPLTITSWLSNFLDYFKEQKKQAGVLDFSDLLLLTRNLLRDNLVLRKYYQEKYSYILVDEFQDTDPLQTEIVFFLSEEKPQSTDWKKISLKKGKLFIVGDPKQSIYRFRRADIELYQVVKENFKKNGKQIIINQNFRTADKIINWLNQAFTPLLNNNRNPYQADYIELAPSRTEESGQNVIFIQDKTDISKLKVEPIRTLEAQNIALFIKDIVENQKLKVRDKKTKNLRSINYGDICILFRTVNNINIYEKALHREAIPYMLYGGKNFYSKVEIKGLQVILQALDNPADSIPVIAALKSPFFSFSDEEIFDFLNAGGEINFEQQQTFPENFKNFEQTFTLLNNLYRQKNQKSLSELIEIILNETKAYESFYLKPDGYQRIANLEKLLNLARTYQQLKSASLKNFVNWLTSIDEKISDEGDFPAFEEEENITQLLTIHKSKGLEFQMVILADSDIRKNQTSRFLIDMYQQAFHFKLGSKEHQEFKTPQFEEASEKEKLKDEAELMRLFYVAATRVRDYLVLPSFPKNSKRKDFTSYLEENSLTSPQIYPITQKKTYLKEKTSLQLKPQTNPAILSALNSWQEKLEKIKNQGLKKEKIITSPSKIKAAQSELTRLFKEEQFISRENLSLTIGLAVHSVLEKINFNNPKNLDEIINKTLTRYQIQDQAEKIKNLIQNALNFEIMHKIKDSSLVLKEVPFLYEKNDNYIEGIIDLTFKDQDNFIIIDYKTDKVTTREEIALRMENYRIQGTIYKEALQEITQAKVSQVVFLFLNANQAVSLN